MIIVRSPLRYSVAGGGTDLGTYQREFGGYIIASALNKHVYVTIANRFNSGIKVSYSQTEEVDNVDEIQHPIFKACLKRYNVTGGDIASFADVPGNTGLGSSSSFTVALLGALRAMRGQYWFPQELAEEACDVEINELMQPIGKQDAYVSSYGGFREYFFEKDGTVHSEKLPVPHDTIAKLNDRLVMVYTGQTRKASELTAQVQSPVNFELLHFIKDLAKHTRICLMNNDLDAYGEGLNQHWLAKRRMAKTMSNQLIDDHYDAAIWAGALGGKLIGAGGGGFLMLYVRPEHKLNLIMKMSDRGLRQLPFSFEHYGCAPIVRV